MRTLLFLAFAISALGSSTLQANDYQGSVGKMRAIFSLTWHDDRTVTGAYSYPDRPGVVYRLSGNNPREGQLYLEEYTGNTLSARCFLQKELTGNSIIWRGRMQNTDGREFPMHFSRARSGQPATPTTTQPTRSGAPDSSQYSGTVGSLGATFSLTWYSDGSVAGSYSHPDRPGTSYRLSGRNPAEGRLFLTEYTGNQKSAQIALTKRLTASEIIWEGTMKNTDGRELPVSFRRARGAGSVAPSVPSSPQMSNHESSRAALVARIPSRLTWNTFPRANEVVDMVPLGVEGVEYFVGLVKEFHSQPNRFTITFVMGEWGDGDEPTYAGPTVTIEVARHLPLPASEIVGQRIGVQVSGSGQIIDLELHAIAVTHVRKSNSEKLEVRGVLHTDELADLYDIDNNAIRAIMARAPKLEFLPDKMALGWDPSEDIFFRSLRVTPEFGIVIQSTSAGPGMLELETLSLDLPQEQNPWISVGDSSNRPGVPPSQRTGEAG